MVLEAHPHRQRQQICKAHLELLVADDLAADVADHPPQAGAQKFEFAPRPFDLVRMAVAPDHQRRPLGQPAMALP